MQRKLIELFKLLLLRFGGSLDCWMSTLQPQYQEQCFCMAYGSFCHVVQVLRLMVGCRCDLVTKWLTKPLLRLQCTVQCISLKTFWSIHWSGFQTFWWCQEEDKLVLFELISTVMWQRQCSLISSLLTLSNKLLWNYMYLVPTTPKPPSIN